MSHVSAVTTHVLDTATGVPAAGVLVRLEHVGPPDGAWRGGSGAGAGEVARALTDADGRVSDLGPAELAPGTYRLVFDTGGYLAGQGHRAFYPEVAITFALDGSARHCHVPLLLSPFGYSTYRGS
jgi:5-hydroxyisourate hydrolase